MERAAFPSQHCAVSRFLTPCGQCYGRPCPPDPPFASPWPGCARFWAASLQSLPRSPPRRRSSPPHGPPRPSGRKRQALSCMREGRALPRGRATGTFSSLAAPTRAFRGRAGRGIRGWRPTAAADDGAYLLRLLARPDDDDDDGQWLRDPQRPARPGGAGRAGRGFARRRGGGAVRVAGHAFGQADERAHDRRRPGRLGHRPRGLPLRAAASLRRALAADPRRGARALARALRVRPRPRLLPRQLLRRGRADGPPPRRGRGRLRLAGAVDLARRPGALPHGRSRGAATRPPRSCSRAATWW